MQMIATRTMLFALVTGLAACAPVPLRTSLPSEWHRSPNSDERRPNFVIIHYTGDDTAVKAFKAHFVPDDFSPGLDARSSAMIHCLSRPAVGR